MLSFIRHTARFKGSNGVWIQERDLLFMPQDRSDGIYLYPNWTNLTLRETADIFPASLAGDPASAGCTHPDARKFLKTRLSVQGFTHHRAEGRLPAFPLTCAAEHLDFLLKISPLVSGREHSSST